MIFLIKFLVGFAFIAGIMALFVYAFFDKGNKSLKKIGIRLSIAGFLVLLLISAIEMFFAFN